MNELVCGGFTFQDPGFKFGRAGFRGVGLGIRLHARAERKFWFKRKKTLVDPTEIDVGHLQDQSSKWSSGAKPSFLFHRIDLLISFRESTPSQNRQLIFYYY